MRFFTSLLLSFVLVVSQANASAVPVTRMQNAVSGIIQNKMKYLGFAANDPRYAVTLNAASGSLAAAAGGGAAVITAGAVTAPAWMTAAIAAGVGALVTYGVNEALDWIFGDGYITTAGQSSSSPSQTGQPGFRVRCTFGEEPYGYGTSISSAGGACVATAGSLPSSVSDYRFVTNDSLCNGGIGFKWFSTLYQPGSYVCSSAPVDEVTLQVSCSSGAYTSSGCVNISQSTTPTNVDYSTAAAALTDEQKSLPVSPHVIADIANTALKNAAAQPGYAGVPYSVTNPITAQDAAAWQAQNPASWPNVGDFVAPQPATNSPWQLPNTSSPVDTQTSTGPVTNPGQLPGTNPGTGQQVNLGSDPGIGSPGLESTPTASSILQPILSLFPDLRSFVVPSHTAQCPEVQFDIFGKVVTMDAHCQLAEGQRQALHAIMMLVWAIVALFIILSA